MNILLPMYQSTFEKGTHASCSPPSSTGGPKHPNPHNIWTLGAVIHANGFRRRTNLRKDLSCAERFPETRLLHRDTVVQHEDCIRSFVGEA